MSFADDLTPAEQVRELARLRRRGWTFRIAGPMRMAEERHGDRIVWRVTAPVVATPPPSWRWSVRLIG